MYYLLEDFEETLEWQTSLRHSCQFFCEIDPSTNAEVVQYREETELTATYVPESKNLIPISKKEKKLSNEKK